MTNSYFVDTFLNSTFSASNTKKCLIWNFFCLKLNNYWSQLKKEFEPSKGLRSSLGVSNLSLPFSWWVNLKKYKKDIIIWNNLHLSQVVTSYLHRCFQNFIVLWNYLHRIRKSMYFFLCRKWICKLDEATHLK